MINRIATPRGCATLMVLDGALLAWLVFDRQAGAITWAARYFGLGGIVFIFGTAGLAAWIVYLWDGRTPTLPRLRVSRVRLPNAPHARLHMWTPKTVWPQRRYKRYGAYVARRRAQATPLTSPSPRVSEVAQQPRYRIRSGAEAVAEARAAQAAAAQR